MPKTKESVVALLRVSWPKGEQQVRSFDAAWHLMLEKAREGLPVKSSFLDFVRKD